MRKPRILLAGNKNLPDYVDAFTAASAQPEAMYLPPVDTDYDGLVLCGGCDIDPKYYGADMAGSRDIDEARDTAEFALLKAYVQLGKPVMGICRGYQMINIYFGGTMHQDIPEFALHRNGTEQYLAHGVAAAADSIIGRLYGTAFSVNSAHHQALDALGEGLRATAWWQDAYIEAIEHERLPIFGVQWHPERMCCSWQREDTVDGLPLIKAFVDMCKK